MLQTMRNLSKTIVFQTLMGLLVVSFAIWGVGDMFRGNTQGRAVATVGSTKISIQAVEHEFQQRMKEAQKALGPDFTPQVARQSGLLDETLNLLIQKTLFEEEVKAMGIKISPQMITEQLASLDTFRNPDGTFNKLKWQTLLRQYELSEKDFIRQQSEEEARRLIFTTFTSVDRMPQTVVDQLYRARAQKRIFEVVTLQDNEVAVITPPNDETLKTYLDEHKKNYMAPEYRALTIAKLSSAEVLKEASVSEADVQTYYDSHKASLDKPERRDLVQVIVQNEREAKNLAGLAHDLGDLTQAAKKLSYPAVPLDGVEATNAALPELYEQIFVLKESAVSEPIKTAMGWHVVQVKKIIPSRSPSFAEIKDELHATLLKNEGVELLTRRVNQFDDALAGGRTLEDMADDFRLRLVRVSGIDKAGLTQEGKKPQELPAEDLVLKAGFTLAAGETGQIIEQRHDDDSIDYLVVRNDEIIPSQVKAFEKIRAQLAVDWTRDEAALRTAIVAEKLAESMRKGGKVPNLPEAKAVKVRFSDPISALGDTDKALPQRIMPQLLGLQLGEVVTAADDDGHHFVLRFADVKPAADPASKDPAVVQLVEKVAKDINNQSRLDIVDEFSRHLKDKFGVTIHQDVFDAMKRQGS